MKQILICVIIGFQVANSFFLSARDLRRIFSFGPLSPSPFPLRSSTSPPRNYIPPRKYPQRHHQDLYVPDTDYNDDDFYYHKDRKDVRNPSSSNKYKKHQHNHAECDGHNNYNNKYHHHHHYSKVPPKKVEPYDDDGSGEIFDYRDRRHRITLNKDSVKTISNDEDSVEVDYRREKEEKKYKNKQHQGYKKDYVTGVLVAIPKIKEHEQNLDGYYNAVKKQNPFFEAFLQNEEPAEGFEADGHQLQHQGYEDFKFF